MPWLPEFHVEDPRAKTWDRVLTGLGWHVSEHKKISSADSRRVSRGCEGKSLSSLSSAEWIPATIWQRGFAPRFIDEQQLALARDFANGCERDALERSREVP